MVASYQSLYSPQTVAGINLPAPEVQAQLSRLSSVVGADLTDLPEVAGLDLKRAQLLQFRDKPLVQLVFARADGTPIALCIIAANSGAATAMQSETLWGMASASWNRGGRAYLLIGGEDTAITTTEAMAFETWTDAMVDL